LVSIDGREERAKEAAREKRRKEESANESKRNRDDASAEGPTSEG
jgi:hypothetical protein